MFVFSAGEAEGLRSGAGSREDHRCHRFHRGTHVPHEMVRRRSATRTSCLVWKLPEFEVLFFWLRAGRIQTKPTWCRRRRPTSSVRRWSSPSTKRGSPGTRIPPKTRRRTTKTNTGRGEGRVVLNSIVLSTAGRGGQGGAERQARHHGTYISISV